MLQLPQQQSVFAASFSNKANFKLCDCVRVEAPKPFRMSFFFLNGIFLCHLPFLLSRGYMLMNELLLLIYLLLSLTSCCPSVRGHKVKCNVPLYAGKQCHCDIDIWLIFRHYIR